MSFTGATEKLQRRLRSIFSKRFHEGSPASGVWNRIQMSMPHEIFCLFLEYQLFWFLLTFWDLSVTFFHKLLIYMINFSYWMSVWLKHMKCLAKEDYRALSLLQFNAYNAEKLSWFCCQDPYNSELELIAYVTPIFNFF